VTTTTAPTSTDTACKEPMKSQWALKVDLAAADALAEALKKADTFVTDELSKATAKLAATQAAKEVETAVTDLTTAYKDLMDELVKCRLDEKQRKKLDDCMPPKVECKCEDFKVPCVEFCCAPGSVLVVATSEAKTITECLTKAKEQLEKLVSLPEQLLTRLGGLRDKFVAALKELNDHKRDLGTAAKIYLQFRVELEPEYCDLIKEADPTKYSPKAHAEETNCAVIDVICLWRKLACLTADKARNDKAAEGEAECKKLEGEKDPIAIALDCFLGDPSGCAPDEKPCGSEGSTMPASGSSGAGSTDCSDKSSDSGLG
jgi:hypothetical protein